MKARLIPVYFKGKRNEEFETQLNVLKNLLQDEAEFFDPVELGDELPKADAVCFPVLSGEAFREIEKIKKITLPVVVITSEFGTVAMWDWEIVTFLKSHNVDVFAPYSLELTKTICRALCVKKRLNEAKFLVFQDNPGEFGMQPEIFKRFYWWEDSCTKAIYDKFGIRIIKKSYKKLASYAKTISDDIARKELSRHKFNAEDVTEKSLLSTIKLYIALKEEIESQENVVGVGINCLNESEYSDTTPCLAYDILLKEKDIIWACEGDTLSLLTEYLVYSTTRSPFMMSNLYPFLMGMAALKHEKISKFPDMKESENCILVAHCGYFGLIPQQFSCQWTLRPKVLAIVDDNALAIDARLPLGKVTLVKLHPTLEKLLVIEGELEDYVQYPGSDCRNGGIIRVKDGRKIMNELYSHHSIIMTGHKSPELEMIARIFNLEIEVI